LITGTDEIRNWKHVGFFTCLGLSIFGFGVAAITIPVLPEMLDAIEEA
jgi:hypothetical protein